MATTVGINNPFRYRGYVCDSETGWYYLQSRYYNPATCRFISADELLSTGQGVIGNNSFAYCGNNPVVRADSEGMLFFTIIGVLVGGIVGGITAAINGEDVVAGAIGGAVTGAVTGALTDITVFSGGAAAPLAVVAVGAIAGAVGDATTQVVSNVRQGQSVGEAFNNIDRTSVVVSAFCGAATSLAAAGANKIIDSVVFQPVKKQFVDSSVRFAFDSTVKPLAADVLLQAGTKSGLMQICSDSVMCVVQSIMYQSLNSVAHKYVKGAN